MDLINDTSQTKRERGKTAPYLNQVKKFKGPLVYIHSYLQFLMNAPNEKIEDETKEKILKTLISSIKGIIDDLDDNLRILHDQSLE